MKGALYAMALNQTTNKDKERDKERENERDKERENERDKVREMDNDRERDRDGSSALTEEEAASLARIDMLLQANPEVATKYLDSNGT